MFVKNYLGFCGARSPLNPPLCMHCDYSHSQYHEIIVIIISSSSNNNNNNNKNNNR